MLCKQFSLFVFTHFCHFWHSEAFKSMSDCQKIFITKSSSFRPDVFKTMQACLEYLFFFVLVLYGASFCLYVGQDCRYCLKKIHSLFSLFWIHFGLSIYISLDFLSLIFSPSFLPSSLLLSFSHCYQSNIINVFLPFSFNSIWKSLSTFLAVLWNNCSYHKVPNSSG